jgi:hypothetical protein
MMTRKQHMYTVTKGKKKKVNNPCNRPWRPIRLWDVEAPTFSRQSAHRWRCLSALRAGRPLPPGRFLVLISDLRAIVRLEGLGQFKNAMTSILTVPIVFRRTCVTLIHLSPCSSDHFSDSIVLLVVYTLFCRWMHFVKQNESSCTAP